MPCFKGIAVSVHAEGLPLPEYSIQKQSRVSRVNTYIPVPRARISEGSASNKPEPSKFAISITLLTPGSYVPYSTPKATPDNPNPRPQVVSGLPNITSERGSYAGAVHPYIPTSLSENETVAAYIYFDGRTKEEVATLLRPGEETWVNSRWVQMTETEGGGLAEREFLFREVGLERWLNGLDLDGKDAAAKIERRRQRFEKRRHRRKQTGESIDEDLADIMSGKTRSGPKAVLRYGADEQSPLERLSDDDLMDDSDSDDDAPPEAAGQIKVAMFRVLASGEIKRGEYSPQFDAHDDSEGSENGNKETADGGSKEADVDHTTSFAQPKSLDPKSISTQTVTGIDGPENPYAVFTFFYRGERQLQKMGILDSSKSQKPNTQMVKRRSAQLDFSSLPPLKSGGTVGFSAFRDADPKAARRSKTGKKGNGSNGAAMEDDSEEDDDDMGVSVKAEGADDKDEKENKKLLSPEDVRHQGELADGVGRIKLKRQHSAEPLSAKKANDTQVSNGSNGPPSPEGENTEAAAAAKDKIGATMFGKNIPDDSVIGSPMKKHRASIYDPNSEDAQKRMGTTLPPGLGDVLASVEAAQAKQTKTKATEAESRSVEAAGIDEDEEL